MLIAFLHQVVEMLNQAALISTEEKLIVLKQVLKSFLYCREHKNQMFNVYVVLFSILLLIGAGVDYQQGPFIAW